MNKNVYLFLVSLMVVGLLSACVPGAAPSAPENVRSMSVSGNGRVTIVPDMATINIGVRTEEDAVTEALEGNTAQANAISRVLQSLGIDQEDIQTSNFNVYPTDRYDPMTGQIEGRYFVVENTVNVTVRDLSSLGEVLSAVIEAGANNIYGINFNVEDREAAVAEARDLAINDAKAKAKAIAESAGVKLGQLMSISVSNSNGPITYFDAKGGGFAEEAAVPVTAGTLSISMDCFLTYEIE